MRSLLTIAAATLVTLTAGGQASAQYPYSPYDRSSWEFQVADSWYRHYLGRALDRAGTEYWVPVLQQHPPEWALAHMLGSDEYLNRNGGTPQGLVIGLYRDILGQRPNPRDVNAWVNRLYQVNGGNRQEMIQEFIQQAGVDVVRGTVGR